MTVGALVLAAGRGVRMGGPNKLTAHLDGKPVVAHAVDAVLAAGLPAVVVTGDRAAAVRAALAGRAVAFANAPDFADGQSASLRAGLAALPAAWDAVLIVLGDMPRVRPETLAALVAVDTDTIVIPGYSGRRGNPVRWPRRLFAPLAALTGDTGGRALFDRYPVSLIEVRDPGILADVDTPEALAALQSVGGR